MPTSPRARTERWRDLLGVVRQKAELASDPEEQEALLATNAMIYEEMLEEPESAIAVYNDILELDPTAQRALTALDRLYERLERWNDLADNIGRQLTIAEEEEEELSLMLRLAALLLQGLHLVLHPLSLLAAHLEFRFDGLQLGGGHGGVLAGGEGLDGLGRLMSAHSRGLDDGLETLDFAGELVWAETLEDVEAAQVRVAQHRRPGRRQVARCALAVRHRPSGEDVLADEADATGRLLAPAWRPVVGQVE